jgi:nucleoside-diphosphate-sugar epimerase
MRVVVLGGTRFIGRQLVAELESAGHSLLVVHRGVHATAPRGVAELRVHRRELARHADALAAFRPEAVVDVSAMTDIDATIALAALPGDIARVAVSSMDVYRAFGAVWAGTVTDAVPLDETSPVRDGRPPDRGHVASGYDYAPEEYEKLDVERRYLEAGATVCRLPMVYGPFDYELREEFMLGPIRAGAREIPIGSGTWLWSRGYAPEIARGIRLALETIEAHGEILNLCESTCAPMREWAEQIGTAAGWDGRLVRVPDGELPEELEMLGTIGQDLLVDPSKAARMLGWVHAEPAACVERSVRWHMENPPS